MFLFSSLWSCVLGEAFVEYLEELLTNIGFHGVAEWWIEPSDRSVSVFSESQNYREFVIPLKSS